MIVCSTVGDKFAKHKSRPQDAIDLAKRFEGFHRVPKHDSGRAHPYVCPASYWTIRYGRLCDPGHPPMSETQAEAYLAQDLMTAMSGNPEVLPGAFNGARIAFYRGH